MADDPLQQNSSQVNEPATTDLVNPDGKLVGISQDQVDQALQNGYMRPTDQDIANYTQGQKYGSFSQQAITGLEGAAQAATFGLSTKAETALGVDPEDIKGRAAYYPGTHIAGQVAGLAASALIPYAGEANILRAAGEGAAGALGLGAEGAGYLSQLGADAVKGAFEGALFQAGDEVSNLFLNDPNQLPDHAIANMGLAAIMGGVFGGAAGAILRKAGIAATKSGAFVSEVDRPAVEAGEFEKSIQNSDILQPDEKTGIIEGLKKQKPEAPQIIKAAQIIDAPVMEGMTSASPMVQKAEDSLINGVPTYSGLKRRALYETGFEKAKAAVLDTIGPESEQTKAQLGSELQDSITNQFDAAKKPISDLYDEIKKYHDIIPLDQEVAPEVTNQLKNFKEVRLSPSSPEGALANRVIKEVGNLKTVDDVKTYKSILMRSVSPTASSGEKRMASVIGDILGDVEDNAVTKFAKEMPKNDEAADVVNGLLDQRKIANAQYKDLITKVKTLSQKLGKGRVYGIEDANNFIRNLTPESITDKLFSKKDSGFLKFFGDEFPNQMEMLRSYQKGVLKDAASTTGEFSPLKFFNQLNKLEPEIQQSLFAGPELNRIRAAETYLRAFPKNFNPSGTSGMSAFREFFTHPTGALVGNARDLAIEKFIKMAGGSPEIDNAMKLAQATNRGVMMMNKAVKAVFNPDKAVLAAAVGSTIAARDKIKAFSEKYAMNPASLLDMGASNPVPQYNTAFAATTQRAMTYLQSQKPNVTKQAPLDTQKKPTAVEDYKYNRAIDLANNPMQVLQHIQTGRLLPSDVQAVQTVYPALYRGMVQKLTNQMIEEQSKGTLISNALKNQLSLFMGHPLITSQTPQALQMLQGLTSNMTNAAAQQNQKQGPTKRKSGTKPLEKLSSLYQTPGQAREQQRSSND